MMIFLSSLHYIASSYPPTLGASELIALSLKEHSRFPSWSCSPPPRASFLHLRLLLEFLSHPVVSHPLRSPLVLINLGPSYSLCEIVPLTKLHSLPSFHAPARPFNVVVLVVDLTVPYVQREVVEPLNRGVVEEAAVSEARSGRLFVM